MFTLLLQGVFKGGFLLSFAPKKIKEYGTKAYSNGTIKTDSATSKRRHSNREMARRTCISRNSVKKYFSILASGPLEEPDNKMLAALAYSKDSLVHDVQRLQQLIDRFQYAQSELVKTGVTRGLLWQEYIGQHPDGYVYSHYCYHFNQYLFRGSALRGSCPHELLELKLASDYMRR